MDGQREQLIEAAISLKKLCTEKAYCGELPRGTASNSNAQALYFAWDELPGKHTCPKCGRRFGGNYKPNARYEGERKYVCRSDKRFLVKNIDFEHVFEAYLNLKEAGYDVKFDLHCSGCIADQGPVPAVFRFRAPGSSEYISTIPDMRYILSSDTHYVKGVSPQAHRSPWDYAIVSSLIKALGDRQGSSSMEKRCREWLDGVRDGNMYRGQPWDTIFNAVNGILGIMQDGPQDDV